MRAMGVIWGLVLMAGAMTATAATPPAHAPNLAVCARPKTPNEELQRKQPLPVPAGFRGMVKADLMHYAISTLGGGTVCVDTSWIESVKNIAGSRDGRFLSFSWLGNEAYGYMLIDRAGRGQVVDTGVPPVASPSAHLLASVDQSESEFGSLSGLAVWRVEPTGIHEVGRVEGLPRLQGWRIDSWAGETCVRLSGVSLDAPDPRNSPRRHFAARPKGAGWTVSAGGCPSG